MNASNIFEIRVERSYTLVRFFGFVDASTVQQIKPALQRQIPTQCKNIVIDLAKAGFLDSHGVGLFVSLLKQAHKNGGRIVFSGASGQPASVLKMVGFNGDIVTYSNDLEAACDLVTEGKKAV